MTPPQPLPQRERGKIINDNVGAIHESPGNAMINKILVYFWLTCVFIFPVFGQEFGSAVITSIPDSADVYVDGYHFGKTPFQPVKVIPGIYKLKLKHKGYDSLLTEMNIESGKRLMGKIELKVLSDTSDKKTEAEVFTRTPKKGEFKLPTSPEVISTQKVFYPRLASVKGLEGKVFLQLLIDLDSTIMDVAIAKSSGAFCLDYEAVKASYSNKFSPALRKDNKPARVWIMWPVTFKVKDNYEGQE